MNRLEEYSIRAMMESKTCEEYVVTLMKTALVENEQLKQEINDLRNTKESSNKIVAINEPIETCFLRIVPSSYLRGEYCLDMTAEEIRAACATREGLESISKEKVGPYSEPLMTIHEETFPYQLKACGNTFGIRMMCEGYVLQNTIIEPDWHKMREERTFPIERIDEMRKYGLINLELLLLAYAAELEKEQ